MRIAAFGAAVLTCVVIGRTPPAAAQVDRRLAEEYFKEARALCERDGGRLWGVSLCAPLVIADQRTHTLATSQPAPDAPWPRVLGLVNAPIEWGGTTWVSFNWDFVAGLASPRSRRELFIHEMFHRVQPGLGLTQLAAANEHVDAMDGRYWLRLEWRALARALQESGAARVDAVRDALAFREARRALYPGSAEDERRVEITEGLPNYTGIVVAASSPADAVASAIDLLLGTGGIPDSIVRTFPSTTIPAYGLLLDASSDGWRKRVRNTDDIGTLLMNALSVQPAANAAAAAERYGGAEIRRSEDQREQQRQDRLAALRRQFIDGPVLVIPGNGSAGSNSTGAVVIQGSGTVYFGAFKASGPWGTLDAEKGVLVATDGRSRRVSAPVRRDDGTFAGDGWTFKAAPGWVVHEGPRPGAYEVVQAPARQPSETRDVVYGYKDGLPLTFDVHRPAGPNGAGLISIVSGGWQSNVEMARIFSQAYPPLLEKGFTVFAVRHGSRPRYPLSSIVADVRRSVRFIRQHAKEYGVDPNRIGVFGNSSGGHLALLLGTTGDSGDPSAADPVLRESNRVAAVVANYPATDLARWATQQPVFKFTEAEAAQFSPIRFVSSGSAPALIVHGDADTSVPIDQGETMYAALTKAGVPASFIRIEGAGHGFEGAAAADLERAYAALMQWFERFLGSAAK